MNNRHNLECEQDLIEPVARHCYKRRKIGQKQTNKPYPERNKADLMVREPNEVESNVRIVAFDVII